MYEKIDMLYYAREKLSDNNQTLNLYQKDITTRYLIKSRDSIQNLQLVILHFKGNSKVTIDLNKRGKLFFTIEKGFNCHHVDRVKTNDTASNLVVIPEIYHKKADFLGDKYKNGEISKKTYMEFINSVKVE
jgi:hypothetical protein